MIVYKHHIISDLNFNQKKLIEDQLIIQKYDIN